MRESPWSLYTAVRPACWCRTCTSGRAPSGCGGCGSPPTTSRASGSPWATTTTGIPGESSATGETEVAGVQVPRRRLTWRIGEVAEIRSETPRARTLFLEVPGWEGHRAGQHVDVRLTAEDGYQTQRSYSIASAPEEGRLALVI